MAIITSDTFICEDCGAETVDMMDPSGHHWQDCGCE